MMQNKFDGVIFDFDGTVSDTSEGIYNGVRYALKKMGFHELTEEQLATFVGPPLFDAFRYYFDIDEDTAHETIKAYREYYSVTGLFESKVYDGMVDLFEALKERNIKIGIATGKPQPFAERLIAKFGIDKYFDTIVGQNFKITDSSKSQLITTAYKNMGLLPERVCMVGDREFDIIGAKDAKITGIGILYGFGSREELENANADYIAPTVKDLKDYLLL